MSVSLIRPVPSTMQSLSSFYRALLGTKKKMFLWEVQSESTGRACSLILLSFILRSHHQCIFLSFITPKRHQELNQIPVESSAIKTNHLPFLKQLYINKGMRTVPKSKRIWTHHVVSASTGCSAPECAGSHSNLRSSIAVHAVLLTGRKGEVNVIPWSRSITNENRSDHFSPALCRCPCTLIHILHEEMDKMHDFLFPGERYLHKSLTWKQLFTSLLMPAEMTAGPSGGSLSWHISATESLISNRLNPACQADFASV